MKYLVALIILITAYGFGRWSAPDKVKIQEKIVYIEKKTNQSEIDLHKHKKQVTTVVTHKDGTTTTTVTDVEDTAADRKSKSTDNTNSTKTASKEISHGAKVTVSALAGMNMTNILGGPDFGMSVTKPILGPIAVGVFGFKSGLVGASVGLTF